MSMPGADRPSFPELYERELVEPLFKPFAEELLDRARLAAGHSLLDLACGTGIVARLARTRLGAQGRMVGVDLSPLMLAVARRVAPDIEWREGNAESLPVADGEQFDVLVCQQGLQFFADRLAAVREMQRALAPQGRLVLATWRPVDEVPLVRDLQRVAERRVGPISDRRHAFGEADAVAALLAEAGFTEVGVETVSKTVRFAEARTFVFLNAMAVIGMSAAAPTLTEEQRSAVAEAVVQDSATLLPPYLDGDGLRFDISTNVATARR